MAFEVRPNSRQIPSSIEYTSDKMYNDLMYAYLQSVSLPGKKGVRYVKSSDASAAKLSRELDMSRQTVTKYFKYLQSIWLVGEKKDGKYDLLFISEELAYLVPEDVLIEIVKKKQRHAVSVYVFFCQLSFGRPIIEYALNAVKAYTGVATNTYSNSYIVTDALDVLQDLKLLEHREIRTQEAGQWKVQKTVGNVTNVL